MAKSNFEIPTPCGFNCDNGKCMHYTGKKQPQCPGCVVCSGKPFWGECKLYKCAQEHKVEHCGLCDEFPCDLLPTHFDPDNPYGKEEAIFRIGQLTIRAKIGTKKWLQQLRTGKLVVFNIEN